MELGKKAPFELWLFMAEFHQNNMVTTMNSSTAFHPLW